MISKIERMSVEVSRDAARRELIAAETNARVAESELMRSLRLNKLPELATPLFILKGDLGTRRLAVPCSAQFARSDAD